ncbi:MAG: Arc family DNA-binding protein [Desulfuromonas sp.]|nr:Arc family DNA-binding protein [Desulfuromonas sp.]
MSRAHPQVNFRIPPDLKEQLEQAAKENHRSITAELVARLEETFEIEGSLKVVAPGAPVTGTAGLLMDLHNELEELHHDSFAISVGANAERIEQHMEQTEASIANLSDQIATLLRHMQLSNTELSSKK